LLLAKESKVGRPYCYLGGNRALTQLSTGQPFFINTDDRGIAMWIILGGVWETFVDDVLCRLAKPGMNFLDVGANMGYNAVKIGRLIGPSGRIFAFEPNPELYPFLKDNVAINDLAPRACPFQLAVGDGEGSQDLSFDRGNMGGGSLFEAAGGSRVATVRVSTLDQCIAEGTRIDLAKIDAEGWEPRILAGAKRLLRDNPAMTILLEVSIAHWRTYADPSETLRALVGSDKEIFRIDGDGVVTPMRDVADFMAGVDGLVNCLISPRTSHARQALAGLMPEAAGNDDRGPPVMGDAAIVEPAIAEPPVGGPAAGEPAVSADGTQPVAAAPANASVRQRTRDLIVKYVPGGEELLRFRRFLLMRGSARRAHAVKDAAAPR
jgi:FkbM family methyltransferase